MENKFLNIGLKAIVIIIAVVGVYFTATLIQGGDPSKYDADKITKLGIEYAKGEGKAEADQLTQAELDRFVQENGQRIKEEKEKEVQANVDRAISFTLNILGIVVIILLVGTLWSIIQDPKKYMVGIISAVVFAIIVFIIYKTTSDEVPVEILARESKLLANDPTYVSAYTPFYWKMISAAFTTTMLLGGIAIFMWIIGPVMKYIK